MTRSNNRSGDLRTMIRAVGGISGGLWGVGPDVDEDERLPHHFPASTVVVATAVCVLVVAAFGGLRVLLAELTGFSAVLGGLWMLSAAVMFLPTAIAFLVGPSRRIAALVAGVAGGLVVGAPVGLWVADRATTWGIGAGLAVGALVLAAVFGLVTRGRSE